MTLDLLLKLLRSHLAALQSSSWPRPHGPSNGPALYLDAADTNALLTELTGIQRTLGTAGWVDAPILRSQSAVAERGGNPAEEVVEITSSTQPLAFQAVSDTVLTQNNLREPGGATVALLPPRSRAPHT